MDSVLRAVKSFIPEPLFKALQPAYHLFLAYSAAVVYGFPSHKLRVIGVTGTNGKSTVVHLITSILEEAGEKTASVSSLRFRVNGKEQKNTLKMTMPGRFKMQKFLRNALRSGCKYAVLEVTSEGIKQFRHIGIDFYIAVLTNVTPEHIESHGNFGKYRAAKAELFKKAKVHILNGEDPSIEYFLKIPAHKHIVYSKKDLPADFKLKLPGDFNIENAVAAYHAGKVLGIERDAIKRALGKIEFVSGRVEFLQTTPHSVVVDDAHTPDALRKIYETLRPPAGKTLGVFVDSTPSVKEAGGKLICILGAAGGGRDKWKRPEMGRIAAGFCDEIILTNEDPYDEDPATILNEIEAGFLPPQNSPLAKEGREAREEAFKKILDRREAGREAVN